MVTFTRSFMLIFSISSGEILSLNVGILLTSNNSKSSFASISVISSFGVKSSMSNTFSDIPPITSAFIPVLNSNNAMIKLRML